MSAPAFVVRMASGPGELPPARIEEDAALAGELASRLAAASHELSLAATDLVAPRPAYWRRYAPPPEVPEERRERQELGRGWHRRVAAALPSEGLYEVRLRRRGVVARIDLLADVPVEIKSGAPVAAEEIFALRPEYIEQLAVYCALIERTLGRIVHLAPDPGGPVTVTAVDVAFDDRERLTQAVDARVAALRAAIRDRAPAALPRCRWFGRGCEYGAAGTCDCTGAEPEAAADLLGRARPPVPRPDVAARWRDGIAAGPPAPARPTLGRFREAIYPRRAYFDRSGAVPAEPEEVSRPVVIGPDLYDRLQEAIEGGPVGDVARLAVRWEGPEEEVAGFRGRPFLVRTSRAWRRILPSEAGARFPQYLLELAFRCAATGTPDGRVVVAFDRAETDRDRLEVLRYEFPDLGAVERLWAERVGALERALAARDPSSLPPCPAWMYDGCPYRAACGCAPAARSQR